MPATSDAAWTRTICTRKRCGATANRIVAPTTCISEGPRRSIPAHKLDWCFIQGPIHVNDTNSGPDKPRTALEASTDAGPETPSSKRLAASEHCLGRLSWCCRRGAGAVARLSAGQRREEAVRARYGSCLANSLTRSAA